MRTISIFILFFASIFFSLSCESSNVQEETETNIQKETESNTAAAVGSQAPKPEKIEVSAKTPAQILVGGSWNNPEAALSEDVIFNADGTMFWRSGTDEGEDQWEIKGTDILFFYGRDYKIEELSESKLVVSEGGEKTTYERN